MKKLLSMLLALLLMTLPTLSLADDDPVSEEVAEEVAEQAEEQDELTAYQYEGDGSYTFRYDAEDWTAPVMDENANVSLDSRSGNSHVLVMKIANSETTVEKLQEQTEELKASYQSADASIQFVEEQTGLALHLPAGDATLDVFQMLYTMESNGNQGLVVVYYMPVGSDTMTFMLVCGDDEFEDHLKDLAIMMATFAAA